MIEDLNFRDLSKAQRKLLAALFRRIREESAASIDAAHCARAETAASIGAALRVDGKSRQTARNLEAKGFVVVEGRRDPYSWYSANLRFTRAGYAATVKALSAPGQRARAISP